MHHALPNRMEGDADVLAGQPLAGDWRDRVKGGGGAKGAVAAAVKKAAPKQAAAAPVTYVEKPDLDALSAGLPPGWKALWDKTSKEIYYGCKATKVSLLS